MDLQKRFGNFEKRRQHFLDLAFFLVILGTVMALAWIILDRVN